MNMNAENRKCCGDTLFQYLILSKQSSSHLIHKDAHEMLIGDKQFTTITKYKYTHAYTGRALYVAPLSLLPSHSS